MRALITRHDLAKLYTMFGTTAAGGRGLPIEVSQSEQPTRALLVTSVGALPDFQRPPVNEVVLGVQFDSLGSKLRSPVLALAQITAFLQLRETTAMFGV